MKALTPGYEYELAHFENSQGAEHVQFIHKESDANTGELHTILDGTTNEEVLKMLIDRLQFIGKKLPSRETSFAITRCEEALLWLNRRTADRIQRGVEGTHKP